jgi:molybdate transport system substrate-binding protein
MLERRRVLLTGLALLGLSKVSHAQAPPLVIFAAASLKTALDEILAGQGVRVSYGASSLLARQIEHGAPVDLFFSADLDWMDYLAGKGLIRAGSRIDLLGNRLALIAPKNTPQSIKLVPGVDLSKALGRDGRLAMANVEAVPAGKYGKASLQSLGLWDSVRTRLAQADNVRAALALVARGEAPLGVVYATDATAESAVQVLGLFPEDSHPPIIYPVAITQGSRHPGAASMIDRLRGPAAQKIFEAQGFSVLNRPWTG